MFSRRMRIALMRQRPLTALRCEPFRNLWYGQVISQIGDALYILVFLFMARKITGSVEAVSWVGVAESLPFLLLTAHAGALADRFDRRKIMLYSDLLCAGLLLAMALLIQFTVKPPVWSIYACAASVATIRAFFMPARSAAVPSLVPKHRLSDAMSLSLMSYNITQMTGLAVSASLLSALYLISPQYFFELAVLANSISFLCSALYIRKLPSLQPERHDEPKHAWADFVSGMRYIRSHHVLLVVLFMTTFITLSISPFYPVYVETNEKWFGGKPSTFALCELTFFVGMVAGSYFAGKWAPKRMGWNYVGGMAVTGLAVLFMAPQPVFWLYCALNVVCGIAVPFSDMAVNLYLANRVPNAFRGRVNASISGLRSAASPLGILLGGRMLEGWGLTTTYVIMGVGMIAVCGISVSDAKFREAEVTGPLLSEEPTDQAA